MPELDDGAITGTSEEDTDDDLSPDGKQVCADVASAVGPFCTLGESSLALRDLSMSANKQHSK